MKQNRALVILILIGLIGAIAYWLNLPSQTPVDFSSVTKPQDQTSDQDIKKTPAVPPTEPGVTTETVETPTPSPQYPSQKTKVDKKKLRHEGSKKVHATLPPLMESVEENSNIGEDLADGEVTTPTAESEAPQKLLTPTETIEDLMKDASLITSGFQETDTDEISGVWTGTIAAPNGPQSPLMLNRIWDHMTDDYLPTSCLAFRHDGKVNSGYLRLKTLQFFEKKGATKSKLIAKLQNRYIFEIWSPDIGKKKTFGRAYEIKKNRLTPIGNVIISKDPEATADMDCSYLD